VHRQCTSTEEAGGLSALERVAHEESVKQLTDMFPEWKHDDMEALFSSCGDNIDATVEAIMELGESGSKAAAAAQISGGRHLPLDAGTSDGQVLDLASSMSRAQLDDYERHVITGHDDTITLAMTVPRGAAPGGTIKVRCRVYRYLTVVTVNPTAAALEHDCDHPLFSI